MSEYFLPAPAIEAVKTSGKRRDMEALRLKARGYTLERIAITLNFESEKKAGQAIVRATAATRIWAVDEQRIVELESLAELEAKLWDLLREGEIRVDQHGFPIMDDFGNPLLDKRFYADIADRILRTKDRRARLLGLNAPTKHEVMTLDSVDAAIKQLEKEIGERAELTKKPKAITVESKAITAE
jgi:hypothetical protein